MSHFTNSFIIQQVWPLNNFLNKYHLVLQYISLLTTLLMNGTVSPLIEPCECVTLP